jgi:hypothetical protein
LLVIGGTFMFSTIYGDDFVAKSLPALIGFGKKRESIVI